MRSNESLGLNAYTVGSVSGIGILRIVVQYPTRCGAWCCAVTFLVAEFGVARLSPRRASRLDHKLWVCQAELFVGHPKALCRAICHSHHLGQGGMIGRAGSGFHSALHFIDYGVARLRLVEQPSNIRP